MIDLKLTAVKGLFLDKRRIRESKNRAVVGALAKFGAFVRTRSRTSIRKRKGASEPGKPPHGHGQELLKRNIFFVVEPVAENVIIGPIKLNKPSPLVLQALEHGGETLVMGRGRDEGRLMPTKIRARPYMQPAFEKELPNAAPLLKDKMR